MKKLITNADIVTMFNTLNALKGRSDIVPGDSNIFWANSVNLKALKEKVEMFQEIVNDLVNSFFTEENSHEEGETRVLNDDKKEEVLSKINEQVHMLEAKTVEVELEPIPKKSLKSMLKSNEKTMSMLDMTVMQMFLEEE